MKTSSFVFVLIGALALGGLVALFVLRGAAVQTQVATVVGDCEIRVGDRDGDCVTDEVDYYPSDPSR